MFYDSLLLFSILFVATLIILPLTSGRAIPPHQPFYTAYLLLLSFLYFGWFWTHHGQTLGMRAWHVRIEQYNGAPVTWRLALLRFCAAILSWLPLGLGYLWMLVDRKRLTWHDRLSATLLVVAHEAVV